MPFSLQRLRDALPAGATGLSRTVSQTYGEQVWVAPSGMLSLPHFTSGRHRNAEVLRAELSPSP